MNPQEQSILISQEDVLAYTAEAAVPKADKCQVPEFLDVNYLECSDVPVALGRVAKEAVEEMVESLTPESSEVLKFDQQNEDKIAAIDLSQSCLSEEEKTQFRKMLRRNRNSLAFTMAELGECKLIPMVIKVDESEGIVASPPYLYSPQKMDIIDEQVKQLLDLGVI